MIFYIFEREFDMNKNKLIHALLNNSISEMQFIPKSELHSHAGRGGTISYLERWANIHEYIISNTLIEEELLCKKIFQQIKNLVKC